MKGFSQQRPRLRRLRALILHRTPVREKDRVVEVFSREEGKLTLLAAGVRRFPSRRAGHLEPLMESLIVVSSTPRGESIRDARVLHSFPRVREDLRRLRVAYYIAQLLHEGTPEHLPDARLYDAMCVLLDALDRPEQPVTPLFLLSADIQLLRHLGVLPDTRVCTRCRRPLSAGVFSFDRRALAFLCRRCAPGVRANPSLTDAVKILRLLSIRPAPPTRLQVPTGAVEELRRILHVLWEPLRVQTALRAPPAVR